MLETLRKGPGFRIAAILAFFAAFCLVAPPAGMAFGHGETTSHCLSMMDVQDHGLSHQDQAHGKNDHGGKTQAPANKVAGCCGLFCLSALLPPSQVSPMPAEPHGLLRS